MKAQNYQVKKRIVQNKNIAYASDMHIGNVTRLRQSELIDQFDDEISDK